LQLLRNFQGVHDPIAIFRAHLERQSASLYVLAGSAVSVLNQLCQRLLQLEMLHEMPISPEAVKQAFLIETLSSQGKIYDYCRYIYDISLQRARGYGALKSVLQLLAEEDGLHLAEIARRMKVTPPTASEYLRGLMEVDLIVERQKKYFFEDPVFKYWLIHSTKGIEVDSMPRSEDLWGLIKKLDDSFQQASTELGLAEVKKFVAAAQGLADRLWFISKSGFASSAIAFAKSKQMLLSDRASIEAIASRLGVRFVK
jgi:transcriptional regulator with XRE-family HTH domain